MRISKVRGTASGNGILGSVNTSNGYSSGNTIFGNANNAVGAGSGNDQGTLLNPVSGNNVLGNNSGNNVTGSNNSVIGNNAGNNNTHSNTVSIGNGATPTADNQIVLGGPTNQLVTVNGATTFQNGGTDYTTISGSTITSRTERLLARQPSRMAS